MNKMHPEPRLFTVEGSLSRSQANPRLISNVGTRFEMGRKLGAQSVEKIDRPEIFSQGFIGDWGVIY